MCTHLLALLGFELGVKHLVRICGGNMLLDVDQLSMHVFFSF
jgi:hypothetical protein